MARSPIERMIDEACGYEPETGGQNGEPEWSVWEGPIGYVVLDNGKRVLCRGGDKLLTQVTEDGGIVFIKHHAAQRH